MLLVHSILDIAKKRKRGFQLREDEARTEEVVHQVEDKNLQLLLCATVSGDEDPVVTSKQDASGN